MKKLTIRQAKDVCTRLRSILQPSGPLLSFAQNGEIKPGLAQEVRSLEAKKTSLLSDKKITTLGYWDIVSLDIFINYHLDDGFTELRASAKTV